MTGDTYELRRIGWVESPLVDRDLAPKQGDEGSPEASIETGDRAAARPVVLHSQGSS